MKSLGAVRNLMDSDDDDCDSSNIWVRETYQGESHYKTGRVMIGVSQQNPRRQIERANHHLETRRKEVI